VAAGDPYTVLGVKRGASAADIKAVYRKLAKTLHPDLHPGDAKIAERFKEVSAAYDFLSDTEKRARYDRGEIDADGNVFVRRPTGYGPGPDMGMGAGAGAGGSRDDILSDLMETMRAARNRVFAKVGDDVTYSLLLDLKDAAFGTTTRLRLKDGRVLDVKIPAGVRTGHIIRLRGQGEPGTGGAASGDALVEITINPAGRFRLEGDDVHVDLGVSLVEAVKGAKVTLETMDGPVSLTVPPGSSGGKVLRLKGKGWQREKGGRGDLYARLDIILPSPIDSELAQFIEAWSSSHPYTVKR
jgi:DnaJ-class molecular chaperone